MQQPPYEDQKFGHITYSQHGEDLMLLNLFDLLHISLNNSRPTWLDIGAHSPTVISNTALLYSKGYRGINVEANPHLIASFNALRTKDVNLNIGVNVKEGVLPFYMYDFTSGRNTFSEQETIQHKADEGREVTAVVELPVVTVNRIVDEHSHGIWPPLLSVDIEGLDFEVLLSADWSKSYPYIIVVETRRTATANMVKMLNTRGFDCLCRMGENLIFVHKTQFPKVF